MSADYGTCGACRHWRELPETRIDDIVAAGQCVEQPPQPQGMSFRWPTTNQTDFCGRYSSRPDAKPPRATETLSVDEMAKSICALCSQDPDVAPTRKGYRWFVHAVESGGTINCEAGNVRELAHEKGE